jgi:hypothetical protein
MVTRTAPCSPTESWRCGVPRGTSYVSPGSSTCSSPPITTFIEPASGSKRSV